MDIMFCFSFTIAQTQIYCHCLKPVAEDLYMAEIMYLVRILGMLIKRHAQSQIYFKGMVHLKMMSLFTNSHAVPNVWLSFFYRTQKSFFLKVWHPLRYLLLCSTEDQNRIDLKLHGGKQTIFQIFHFFWVNYPINVKGRSMGEFRLEMIIIFALWFSAPNIA